MAQTKGLAASRPSARELKAMPVRRAARRRIEKNQDLQLNDRVFLKAEAEALSDTTLTIDT